MASGERVDVAMALDFLDRSGRPVERAWARYLVGDGSRDAVVRQLTAYQNDDGGFGHGLEPDIAAPDSQPFGARLAMLILISLDAGPAEPIIRRLTGWLEANQGEDGGWRFAPGVYQHQLAPWFAGWTFPNLNPALDLAGAATRLGIGSPLMHERVAKLFGKLATLDEARTGEFYNVLPYVEYVPWVAVPDQEAYLTALADNITAMANNGQFADAGHFFELAGPPTSALSRRLAPELIASQLSRLEAEQQADGGWPTPYDPAWRAWSTAASLATLRDYGRLNESNVARA